MSESIVGLENEEVLYTCEISDEALETAASARENPGYTIGACTGLSVCVE